MQQSPFFFSAIPAPKAPVDAKGLKTYQDALRSEFRQMQHGLNRLTSSQHLRMNRSQGQWRCQALQLLLSMACPSQWGAMTLRLLLFIQTFPTFGDVRIQQLIFSVIASPTKPPFRCQHDYPRREARAPPGDRRPALEDRS